MEREWIASWICSKSRVTTCMTLHASVLISILAIPQVMKSIALIQYPACSYITPSHVLMYLPDCLKLWKVMCTSTLTACACTNYRFTIVSAWIRLFSDYGVTNVVTWEPSHMLWDFHITIILLLQANEYTHPTNKSEQWKLL